MRLRWKVLTVAAVAGAVLVLGLRLSGTSDRISWSLADRREPLDVDRNSPYSSSLEGKSLDESSSELRPSVEYVLSRKSQSTAAGGRLDSKEHLVNQWKKPRLTNVNQLPYKWPDSHSTKPPDRRRVIDMLRHAKNGHGFDRRNLSVVGRDERNVRRVSSVTSMDKLLSSRLSDIQTGKPQPIPYMGNYNCIDRLCLQFMLTDTDKRAALKCRVRPFAFEDVKSWPGKCHFMNGTFRAPVALASPPSSGNTWIRGLLEQATGICTGAIYCDRRLAVGGFNGEHIHSGIVLAVKLHSPSTLGTNFDRPVPRYVHPLSRILHWYGSAIVIVRNPFDTLVSDWNRIGGHGNHTSATMDASEFGYNSEWNKYVQQRINSWASFILSWANAGTQIPILLIRYEDVKTDSLQEVKRMLDFLGMPYSVDELKQRLSQDFTAFRRQHKNEDFDHYTNEQRQLVLSVVQETVSKLSEINTSFPTQGLQKYLN